MSIEKSAPPPLVARIGVDQAVAYGVLSKIALGFFSLVSILLIAWRLPAEVQGYYYTYLNLIALQIFAEFGLAVVIVQICSHLWASLRLDESGVIQGEPEARSRLVGLGRLSLRWYGVAGLAAAILIGASGIVFFSNSPTSPQVRWQAPWISLCALSGVKMWLIPVAALLEGTNQVASVYRYRCLNAVVGGAVTAISLVLGMGLWSPSLGVASEILVGGLYLLLAHGRFLRSFLPPGTGSFDWKREVLPLQLRIGGSWIAGYFVTYLFTPVLFHFQGPRAAGQWGMTWSMFAMVTSISMLWVSTKAPQFGVWIARREFEMLDRSFFRAASRMVMVASLGAVSVWLGVWLLHRTGHRLADRLLAPFPAGLLAATVIVQSVSVATSVYLRAHMKEPLTFPSVVQAFLIAVLAVVCARTTGSVGAAASYLGVVGLLGVPWSIMIWWRCRSAWHAPATGLSASTEDR
jgi:hypothetical protein